MGFKEWAADAPVATFSGEDGTLTLRKDRIEFLAKGKFGKETMPLGSGVEVRLEDGEAVQSRITATRLVLVGVFALAWKKRRGGEKYLTVSGPEDFWMVEVPRKRIRDAAKFRGAVEGQLRKAEVA